MTRLDKAKSSAGDAADINDTRTLNDMTAIDPAQVLGQYSTPTRSLNSKNKHRKRTSQKGDFAKSHQFTPRSSGELARSREDMQRPQLAYNGPSVYATSQQSASRSVLGYPTSGLIDRGSSLNRVPHLYNSSVAQMEANGLKSASGETTPQIMRSPKKRTSADAGFLSADTEDHPNAATAESRRSTNLSKRAKVLPEDDKSGDDGDRRIRKVSKLKMKIAEGRAPKRGSLGPDGEVRIRADGLMEFRDVDNLNWTLAAYHNYYRRHFLDEAAEDGEFDHTPARGEAENDETSYEPEQKSWGPSRADWQTIVNSEGTKVMFEVDKPKSRRPPQEPKNWVHNGRILLDSKNHPVKKWPGLNKTLSSEIESWRWEALMRKFPWLTVADLLARMPHYRVKKGQVVPLQTPQAFTNRAHRFRVPNQIPATKPKKGSGSYKEGILKNLEKKMEKTTERLTTLNPDQINEVKKKNKGRFFDNSRYIVKEDNAPKTLLASKKRNRLGDDDTESEPEQKVKRSRTRTPQNQDGYYEYANLQGTDIQDQPTESVEQWVAHERGYNSTYTAGPMGDQSQEYLVLLFASIEDKGLAMVENPSWTSPAAVLEARRAGNQQTRQIGVYWYSSSVPRHVTADCNVVEDVVDIFSTYLYQAEVPIDDDDNNVQCTPPNAVVDDFVLPSTHSNASAGIDPSLDEPIYANLTDFPLHHSYHPQMITFPSSRTPMSAGKQVGWYQTQSDTLEETWRDQYGPSGF